MTSETGRDPVDDLDTLRKELELYQPALAAKDQLVAANKMDAVDDESRVQRLEQRAAELGLACFRISAATGLGLPPLLEAMWQRLASPTAEVEAPCAGEVPVSDPGLVRRRRGSVRFARVEHVSGREATPNRRSGRYGRRGRSGADSKK